MKKKVFFPVVAAMLLSAGLARAGLIKVEMDPRVAELEQKMFMGEISTEAYIEALRDIYPSKKARTKATLPPISRAADSDVRSFTAVLTEPGTLASVIGNRIMEIDSLTVEGPVNEEDFRTMWQCAAKGSMHVLNLENALPEDNKIPDYAMYHNEFQEFSYQIDLDRVILPEGITEIGKYAFAVTRLQHINLPSSLRKLGRGAFYHCEWLETSPIVIPEGVEDIPERCFAYMHSSGRFELPSSLKSIGVCAFYDNRMTEIKFKEGLKKVGQLAFYGCDQLRSVKLPTSCTKLEPYAFGQLYSVKEFIFSPETPYLPEHVLEYTWDLESITIPGEVYFIGNGAFNGCEALKQVTIENGVRYIYSNAFERCSIETLIIPSSIDGIDSNAFLDCKELKRIFSLSPIPPRVYSLVAAPSTPSPDEWARPFTGCPTNIPVYVPVGSAENYRNTWGWDLFTNIIETNTMDITAGIDTPAADSLGAAIAAEPGGIRLTSGDGGSVVFAIHSADGRQVAGGTLTGERHIDLPAGIYIVTCGSQRSKIAIHP